MIDDSCAWINSFDKFSEVKIACLVNYSFDVGSFVNCTKLDYEENFGTANWKFCLPTKQDIKLSLNAFS